MDLERVRLKIKEIAASPTNVDFDELVGLLDNHISPMFPNYNHHGNPHHAFTLGDQTFNIAQPHRNRFVKKCYVEKFLDAMLALGLYEEETKK
jgi:hypothetical protein